MMVISADVLMESLKKWRDEWDPVNNGYLAINEVIENVEKLPTIDAEPVVRCKDCKYYLKSNEVCQLINTRLHFFAVDKKWLDDSFCSWAERKEE